MLIGHLKVTKNEIEVTYSMKAGEEHPMFPEYDVDFIELLTF